MNKSFFEKRIPTLIGLSILAAGIAVAVFILGKNSFLKNITPTTTSAPKNIRISSVTENEFTVSWTTDEPEVGFIKYGESPSKLDQVANDNRDQQSGEKSEFKTHLATIKNLEPEKKYYFKIGAGTGIKENLYDNEGSSYEIVTGPSLGSPGKAQMASGTIINQDKSPAEGAIVILTTPNSAPQATLSDKQGGWVLMLNKSRSKDLGSWAIIDEKNTTISIEVFGGEQKTDIIASSGNVSPLPQVINLAQASYNFKETPESDENNQLAAKPNANEENVVPSESEQDQPETGGQTPESFPLDPVDNSGETINSVKITYPEANQKLSTQKPRFRGTGPVGKVLTVEIEEPEIVKTVTINEEKNWEFQPSQNLTTGRNSVSITYIDDSGSQKNISRSFEILETSENEPEFTATPSAQTSPSPLPSPSPSPDSRATMPATDSGVPETGIVGPTFFTLVFGLILLAGGSFISFSIDKQTYKKQ